jgi:hypothetical protein
VESLDTPSRQDVDIALSMFLDRTRAGITIVSLMDNQTYTHPVDTIKFIEHPDHVARQRKERDKSKTVRAAWQKKRDDTGTRNLTAKCPAWLIPKPGRQRF